MKKAISSDEVTVRVNEVTVDDHGDGNIERTYRLLLNDPDFITDEVSEQNSITLEVRLEKRQDGRGGIELLIHVDGFHEENS